MISIGMNPKKGHNSAYNSYYLALGCQYLRMVSTAMWYIGSQLLLSLLKYHRHLCYRFLSSLVCGNHWMQSIYSR